MVEFIVGFGVGALASALLGGYFVAQHVKDFKSNQEELGRIKGLIKTIQGNSIVCDDKRCVYRIRRPSGQFGKMYLPKV